jgi:hypothetical protein
MLGALPFPNQSSAGDRQSVRADLGAATGLSIILFRQHPQPFDRFLLQAAIGNLLDPIGGRTLPSNNLAAVLGNWVTRLTGPPGRRARSYSKRGTLSARGAGKAVSSPV